MERYVNSKENDASQERTNNDQNRNQPDWSDIHSSRRHNVEKTSIKKGGIQQYQ